jgi:multiple sugar transport system substrate-binding protein
LIVFAAVLTLATGACAGSTASPSEPAAGTPAAGASAAAVTPAPPAAEPITLSFWDPDTRPRWIAARDMVIADFQAANPNITVEQTPFDWGQMLPKLQSAVAAGLPPDVFFINPPSTVFAATQSDLLQPVTDAFNALPSGTFPKDLTDPLTVNGEVMALPFATFPHVIWYRKDLFEQAGIKPPGSWADILAAAKALNKPPAQYGIVLYEDQVDPHILIEVMASNGSSLLDEAGNVVINSPETIKALDYWKELWQYTTPDAISKGNLDQRLVFASGGGAIIPTQISMIGVVTGPDSKITADQVATVPVPNDSGKRPAIINDELSLSIPKGAKHPEAAKAFLEFWFQPDEYTKFVQLTNIGHLPTETVAGAPDSAYWTSPDIAPVADVLKGGVASLSLGSFFLGMYPVPNTCEPQVLAAGTIPQMAAHVVSDGWDSARAAAWAEAEIKNICNK